jgi:hypothetical protein
MKSFNQHLNAANENINDKSVNNYETVEYDASKYNATNRANKNNKRYSK